MKKSSTKKVTAKTRKAVKAKVDVVSKRPAKRVSTKSNDKPLRSIAIHPRFTEAISSMKRLTTAEFSELQTLSAQNDDTVTPSTGCWISDSGGQQHCVNLPADVCTRKGGIAVPIKCPNA
jgi:hypothetical protein